MLHRVPMPAVLSICAALLQAGCGAPAAHPAAPVPQAMARATPPAAAPAGAAAASAGAAASVTADASSAIALQLDAHLEFLASDDLGGRETGTVQSLVTGQYVAAAFRTARLQPGGDEGWFQKFPMEADRLVLDEARLRLVDAAGLASELRLFDDYLLSGYGAEGLQAAGELVFAGQGLVDEEAGVDDYAGLDVAGRFAVVLDGRPAERRDLRQAAHWRAKRSAARERGALGLITLVGADETDSQRMLAMLEDNLRHPTLGLPVEERDPAWPQVVLRSDAAQRLAHAVGLDLAAERAARAAAPAPGRALSGLTVELSAPVEAERTHGYNILGLLPGSDAELRDEVVVVSAHNDHIGTLSDGRVNNGADDNASGTATLLAAAASLALLPPPRRTVLFLSVSGEEKGLWGSAWWVEHPTVPLERVVANINIDMVGRNDPDAVGATPSPAHPDYNSLVARAVELGPAAGLEITWNAPKAGDDAVDNYYQRSDHYNFATQGIPVVFFFSGIHEDYHRPTDDIEKIDRGKLRRMTRLITLLVRDVADADARPHKLAAPKSVEAPVEAGSEPASGPEGEAGPEVRPAAGPAAGG